MVGVDLGFCPQCGGQLEPWDDEGHHRSRCVTCGFIVFRNPFPVVAVAVVDGDSALFIKRARAPEKGCWCMPGGYLELDETPQVGAARELSEETGIEAAPSELTFVGTAYERLGKEESIVMLVFGVPRGRTDGSVVPGDDAAEARYWTRSEITENPPDLRVGDPAPILWAIDSLGEESGKPPLW